MTRQDWNPKAYGRYEQLRRQPAMDLLARVGDLPNGHSGGGGLVDLCCGTGVVGAAMAARYPGRSVTGVDASPAMLEAARASGAYGVLEQADVRHWQAATPPALIFSNAALQWVGDHAALLPRLARMLVPGGVLAVQMPRQWAAPSHRFLRDIAASLFPDRFDAHQPSPVEAAVSYWEMLNPLGQIEAWETDYVQLVDPVDGTGGGSGGGHPVRHFTQSTAARPFLEQMTDAEAAAFLAAYDAALGAAYPLLASGGALMPFRRVFFVLRVG